MSKQFLLKERCNNFILESDKSNDNFFVCFFIFSPRCCSLAFCTFITFLFLSSASSKQKKYPQLKSVHPPPPLPFVFRAQSLLTCIKLQLMSQNMLINENFNVLNWHMGLQWLDFRTSCIVLRRRASWLSITLRDNGECTDSTSYCALKIENNI